MNSLERMMRLVEEARWEWLLRTDEKQKFLCHIYREAVLTGENWSTFQTGKDSFPCYGETPQEAMQASYDWWHKRTQANTITLEPSAYSTGDRR